MPINDYLQGIENYTSGQQQDVTTAAGNLSELQTGAGNLPSMLKKALNEKLNYNKDIINQQSDVMQQYFAAPSAARAKYQDVWNPFEREKLVAQDRTMALKPYDTLSGVLQQRMGDVADITEAGVQGWQGMVNAAATQLEAAQTRLGSALQAYQIAGGQQESADNLALAIANAKEASRQFNVAQQLEREQFGENIRQFDVDQANRLKMAGGGGGGGSDVTSAPDNEISAYAQMFKSGKITADQIPVKIRGAVLSKANQLEEDAKKEADEVARLNEGSGGNIFSNIKNLFNNAGEGINLYKDYYNNTWPLPGGSTSKT